jgi:AraC-like DNA-binding protein
MIESYFCNGHTVHTFRESGSVQRKPGSGRAKVRTEENIETVQCRMEDELQIAVRELSQHTELSVSTYQRIIRKDFGDSVQLKGTGTTFLMFSLSNSTMMNWILGIFNKTGLQPIQHGRLFVICGNFLMTT